MLSSVFKDIPNDSIIGAKIKDNTNLNYIGTLTAVEVDAAQPGESIVASLITTNNHGRLSLYTGTDLNIFLAARVDSTSYINSIIVLGSDTALYSTTDYPTQVVGGFAVNGNAWLSGHVTASHFYTSGGITADTGYFIGQIFSSALIYTALSNGIKVGSYQPSAANWQNMTTQQTTLKDLTSLNVTQLIAMGSETISAAQWGYLSGLDQPLATTDPAVFSGVKNTGAVRIRESNIDIDWNTKDDASYYRVRYWFGSTARIITLNGTTTPTNTHERQYIISNDRVAGNVTLTTDTGNMLNGSAHPASFIILPTKTVMLFCNSNEWRVLEFA